MLPSSLARVYFLIIDKQENEAEDEIEISDISKLLKLFKINMNSDTNTFEHQNQKYKISLNANISQALPEM